MNKSAFLAAALLAASANLVIPMPAHASPAAHDLSQSARGEVAAALFAASATTEAAQRASDATILAQRHKIEALQAQGAGAKAQLAAAQETYVAQLAARDRAYAQEIAVFRNAVEDIASTPEGEVALARFNAGDEHGALKVLDEIADARERARRTRANVEAAADKRRVAALALETRARGKLDTNAVITRFEEVTRLDPGVHYDWVELDRLYQDAGRIPDARRAAQQALATASSERDKSAGLNELGNILVAQGDLAGATSAYTEELTIFRKLAAADPSNAALERDVSVGLNKIGEVLVARGDLVGAKGAYGDMLAITRELAAADPTNASARRDVSVSLNNVGDVLEAQGDLAGAKSAYGESLAIARKLAAADPSNVSRQRDVSVSLEKDGDVLKAQGDLAGAKAAYDETLAIARKLAAADQSNAGLQRDVSVSLEKDGDVLKAQGDLAGAKSEYGESLAVRRRLAAADPSNAGLQRDVWVSMWKLTTMPNSGVTWSQIVSAMEDMQRRGVLRPTDVQYLDQARAMVAAGH